MNIKEFRKPNKKNGHSAYIRSLLVLHGIKQKELAKDLGVSNGFISMVIHGREKSKRVQIAIAQALNMNFDALWF